MGLYRLYSISRKLFELHIPLLPSLLKLLIRVVYAASIPYTCVIGKGTVFPHGGQGVVLHDGVRIGRDCRILPNVVIGGRSDLPQVPVIEDSVLIGAGAVVLGPITVGKGAYVGANAVVLSDVPGGALAVGVPAKILMKENSNAG